MIGTMTDLQARILNELCIIYPSSLHAQEIAGRVNANDSDTNQALFGLYGLGLALIRCGKYAASPLGIQAYEELNQYPPHSSDPDKVMCLGQFTFHDQPLTQ